MNKFLLLLCVIGVFFTQLVSAGLVVKTREGRYRGTTFPSGARAFLGIPFAQPPVGDLRWKVAKPALAFDGIRDAKVSGDCCPQSGPFKNLTVVETEDCLTLDVYTPLDAAIGDLLPVKVYIHGGGFGANSAALFPGDQLAVNTSSVVVVINYRLSFQGFLVFTPLIAEGNGTVNHGLTDQQLALRWVRKNVHRFGGNKHNVLIFGNSAGGMSVLMHYTFPSSRKLFNYGVSQSAGPWNFITAETAARINDPLAARFGCYNNVTKTVDLSCLRAVPITSIYNYSWANAQPVYDKLFTGPIAKTFANKEVMEKAHGTAPLMIGRTNQEGNQFAWLALRVVTRNPRPALNATFPQFFGIANATLPFTSDIVLNITAHYAKFAENGNYFIPLRELLGDFGINCGVDRTAYSALNTLPKVFKYYFTRNTEKWRLNFLNATHTAEVPYLFMTNGTIAETVFTADETKLARRLAKYLSNFQDTKNPNIERNNDPILQNVELPNWPNLMNDQASTLVWDIDMPVIKNPTNPPCEIFWNSLLVDQIASRSSKKTDLERLLSNPLAEELNFFH